MATTVPEYERRKLVDAVHRGDLPCTLDGRPAKIYGALMDLADVSPDYNPERPVYIRLPWSDIVRVLRTEGGEFHTPMPLWNDTVMRIPFRPYSGA